jgi:hypothetical protein
MMSTPEDWLEQALRQGLAPTARDDEAETSEGQSTPVPPEWREKLLARVARRSSVLLGQRILEHAEGTGWSLDALAEEAGDCAEAARDFLRRGGDPQRLAPEAFARLLWRVELPPPSWRDLLRQAVSAFATVAAPQTGTIMGRTTGLSGISRAEALGDLKRHRDSQLAVHTAERYVDEVTSEWKRLTNEAASQQGPED